MTTEEQKYKALKAKIKKQKGGTLAENVELFLSGIRAVEEKIRLARFRGDSYGTNQRFSFVLHHALDVSIMIRMNATREQIAEACELVSSMSRGTASPAEVWMMAERLYQLRGNEALRVIGRDPKEEWI